MIRRRPVLTSTVTAMPGVSVTNRSSIAMALAPSETRAANVRSCGFGASLPSGAAGLSFCDRGDGVARDVEDAPRQEPVAGEGEGVDLDLGVLAFAHKADIPVRDHGLDLELAAGRHHHEQRLRRRHHPAHGVDGELLHRAGDRSDEVLEPRLLLRLGDVLPEARRLALGFGQVARKRRSNSDAVWLRVSARAAMAASASFRRARWTPSSCCCSTSFSSVSRKRAW